MVSTANLKELHTLFVVSSKAEADAAAAIEKVLQLRENGALPQTETETGTLTKDGRPNRLTPEGIQKIAEARRRRAERERQGLTTSRKLALVASQRQRDPLGHFLPKKKGPHSIKKAA